MHSANESKKKIQPITAITATPANKLTNAKACFQKLLRHNRRSMMKSPASISTHAAYINMPAERADITPCVSFMRADVEKKK